MADPIFCCPCASITPLGFIRSIDQLKLWEFSWFTASHPSHSQEAFLSPPKPKFQRSLLREAPFCIQFEKWVDGEKSTERYFIPSPCRENNTYIEVTKDVVVDEEFEYNWEQIKLRCGCIKQSTFFLLKFLSGPAPRIMSLSYLKTRQGHDAGENYQIGGECGHATNLDRMKERKRKRGLSGEEHRVVEENLKDACTNLEKVRRKECDGKVEDDENIDEV